MAESQETIVQEIKDYIDSSGGDYGEWYVGIARNSRERLFDEHDVLEQDDFWIYREAGTETAARVIEKYFIDVVGTLGGPGGGGTNTTSVYAYRMNDHTNP